jgi:hypothetical protein
MGGAPSIKDSLIKSDTVFSKEIGAGKTAKSASAFLENPTKKLSFTINKALMSKGKGFTDRFYA